MTVTVRIPGPLRPYCEGRSQLVVEGTPTVAAALAALPTGVRERVLDEQGRIRQHVNVFVGETNVRETAGLETALADGATVFVIPAVSGGVPSASRASRSRPYCAVLTGGDGRGSAGNSVPNTRSVRLRQPAQPEPSGTWPPAGL